MHGEGSLDANGIDQTPLPSDSYKHSTIFYISGLKDTIAAHAHSSFAAFRHRYSPSIGQTDPPEFSRSHNRALDRNLRFYRGEIACAPDNVYIDQFHT
jgi:hypothetical protein